MKNRACPGCWKDIDPRSEVVEDAAGRPWHRKCSTKMLADHFRTPLSPEDLTAKVEFDYEFSDVGAFCPPHSMHLREIVLPEGGEVGALFVGQMSVHCCWAGATIRAEDLRDRRLIVDHDVPMGLGVSMSVLRPTMCRLVGERRPESAKPKPSPKTAIGVFLLSARVDPGEVEAASFRAPCPFRAERLVCDDWEGWKVVDVRVGADDGRAVSSSVRLAGRDTPLPAYVSRTGECVSYRLRHGGTEPRRFEGRVYGEVSWS